MALKSLFRIRPVDNQVNKEQELRRCLTAVDLTMLGIGAIIGAGIFVLTGIAAATQAGPAIIFSYVLAGFACVFSALAYAELAASVGGCGSAYGYAFASIGEFIAWIIGWDLLLSYGLNVATVSIGWSGYVQNTFVALGIPLPHMLTANPFEGGLVNLPAMLVIFLLAWVLSIGVKESAKINKMIVFIKLAVIALFIGIGLCYFDSAKWHPFLPFGAQGIVNGAGLIFFAYIGFDVVSTAAEETINPGRNLPIGIIASLVICTLIYIVFAGILTGIADYSSLNNSSAVSGALLGLGHKFAAGVIAIGAIAGLTTTILAMYYGCTRVYLGMARDKLLPNWFMKIDTKSRSPRQLIWMIGSIIAIVAGFFPIMSIASLVNMGTLAAFVAVCASVLVLRYTKPNMERPFRSPWHPFAPIMGMVLSLYLMSSLSLTAWYSFLAWTALGLVVYFSYSRYNSIAATPVTAAATA